MFLLVYELVIHFPVALRKRDLPSKSIHGIPSSQEIYIYLRLFQHLYRLTCYQVAATHSQPLQMVGCTVL